MPYNHKKDSFSRKIQENQDLHDDNDWIMILDSDDLKDSGVYDELADVYNSYIANIFVDWVNTPEYMKSNYKIWIPQGRPDLSLISDGTPNRSVSLFIDDKITFKGGLGGMSLSARYIKSNLVKIKSDLEHDDVLFCGKRYLLSHVNPASDVEFFQDPDGNITDDTLEEKSSLKEGYINYFTEEERETLPEKWAQIMFGISWDECDQYDKDEILDKIEEIYNKKW